jgi:hypothetical protein
MRLEHESGPQVVVLGGSLVVRCISGEAELTRGIQSRMTGGPAPRVSDLTFDGQTEWEMAYLLGWLGSRYEGVVVLGMNPDFLGRLPTELYDSLWGLGSRAIEERAAAYGADRPFRTGIFLLDNWRFFVPRWRPLVRNLTYAGPVAPLDPIDETWIQGARRESERTRELEALPSLIADYDRNHRANFAIIADAVARLGPRAAVLLLDGPRSPLWRRHADGSQFFARYESDVRVFADTHGFVYLRLNDDVTFADDEIVDYEGHIGSKGARDRCTDAVATHTALMLSSRADSAMAVAAAPPR